MKKSILTKVLCVSSILAIGLFTAGCDDDDNRHASRHHHNPPPKHHNDRHHHHTPSNHHNNNKDKHKHPRPPHRAHRSEMAGVYKATALNSVVTSQGSSYYLDISEDDNELYLTLPNGKEYPINIEGEEMSVAGGKITEQAGGTFAYKDKMGGSWLIEKVD